ncbi:hypothetical protein HHI36_006456 [Cryptolaemus montrouzieri]|uniref:L antigen family member 3 n=1 Tax=Cryptolaemus montrouzieri TaxID=559131 RepID=A0ABD2NX98_9CUCU
MDNNESEDVLTLSVEIPFPNSRIAEVVLNTLIVDSEPKRGGTIKTLKVIDNKLIGYFVGTNISSVRVSVNSFFENIHLISETIQLLGEPVSEKYSHFENA